MRQVWKYQTNQMGFSLLEVLIAMLVATLGIAAVMLVHVNNLRHVRDNADLNQGQLLLNNMVYQVQQGIEEGTMDATIIKENIAKQATDIGLDDFNSEIQTTNNGQLVSIQWRAHDVNDVVVRRECSQHVTVNVNHHCLALWVWGQP